MELLTITIVAIVYMLGIYCAYKTLIVEIRRLRAYELRRLNLKLRCIQAISQNYKKRENEIKGIEL